MAFPKPKASSTARGYGAAHRAERQRRMAATRPTDLCGYCHRPLGPPYGTDQTGRRVALWNLPHNRDRTAWLPGMWHASCNASEGAKEAVRRRTPPRRRATTLRW